MDQIYFQHIAVDFLSTSFKFYPFLAAGHSVSVQAYVSLQTSIQAVEHLEFLSLFLSTFVAPIRG